MVFYYYQHLRIVDVNADTYTGVRVQCLFDLIIRPEQNYFARLARGRARAFQDRVDSLSTLAPGMTNISASSTGDLHAEESKIKTFLDVVRQIAEVPIGEIYDDKLHFGKWSVEETVTGDTNMTNQVSVTLNKTFV